MNQERTYTAKEVATLVRSNLVTWACVVAIFCVIPAVMLYLRIPELESLFKGFGTSLPASTQFLLAQPVALLVMPVIGLLVLVFALSIPTERLVAYNRHVVIALAVVCCLSLVSHALAVRAMFAPLFMLGAVV